jgi:MFS family permease
MALFEIPTGIVADTVGRRASFLLSIVIVFAGTLGYVGVFAIGVACSFFVPSRCSWASATPSTQVRWRPG